MDFTRLACSESFFEHSEPLAHPEISEFGSVRGRTLALIRFFKIIALTPLAFFFKMYKTILAMIGVGVGALSLIVTLCSSSSIRAFFVQKVSDLAKNLADWVLWPFAIFLCLSRLLLAVLIHPALYFRV